MNHHTMSVSAAGDRFGDHEQPLPWILLACSWALMLITFTLPGRSGPTSASELDFIAILKLGVRVVTFLILACLLLCSRERLRRFAVVARLFPIGLFVGWAVLSVLWSPLQSMSLGQASSLVVLTLLAANLGVLCRETEKTSKVLRSLSAGILFCSLIIVLARLLFPGLCSLSRDDPGIVHPTAAAATASLGLMVLVGCNHLWGWKWTRVLLLPGLLIHGSLLFLAANRTAMFLCVALLLVIVCAYSARWLLAVLLVGGSLVGTAYLTLDPGLELAESGFGVTSQYVTRGKAEEFEDYSGRKELWEVVWNSHRESPWLGHGYFVSSAKGELYVWYTWANWTAHNLALQALVSTGIVGTVLLILGLFVPLFMLWRCRHTDPQTRNLVRLLTLVGVWYFVWGLFNSSILGPLEPESVVFFTMLGLAVGHIPVSTTAKAMWAGEQATGYGPAGSAPQTAQS